MMLAISILASVASGQENGTRRITTGDPLEVVYRCLGTPMIEYPLNGTLIQEYRQCTIICSNEVVISADYKIPEQVVEKPAEEDPRPTIQEIKERALQGDAESQYTLAYCFQFGQLVDQDYRQAVGWYTKAAMQGHMPAQHNLGYLYKTGKGVEKDYEQAYVWALLAATNGNDTLKKSMDFIVSDEQKQEAQVKAGQMLSLIKSQQSVTTPQS